MPSTARSGSSSSRRRGLSGRNGVGKARGLFRPLAPLAGDPERDSDHGTLCWEIGELLALASSPP